MVVIISFRQSIVTIRATCSSSKNFMTVTHFGSVSFTNGKYEIVSGSRNWNVQPISGFVDPPIRLPLGQVEIEFSAPLECNYSVLVSAWRTDNTPLLAANYSQVKSTDSVVHIFDPVTSRTLQNGSFSFAVLTNN